MGTIVPRYQPAYKAELKTRTGTQALLLIRYSSVFRLFAVRESDWLSLSGAERLIQFRRGSRRRL